MPALTALRESPAGVAAAEAWHWWTGELMALVPASYRPDPDKRPRADIRPAPGAVRVELMRDGEGQLFAEANRLEDLGDEGWAELRALIEGSRARILLEAPDAFFTRIALPRAARRRLRSAVALQLSQLSPLDPDLLCWGMKAEDSGADKIDVQVAMARTARIAQLQDLFAARDIVPPPVLAATPDGAILLAPGGRAAAGNGEQAGMRSWVIAALLLASIPLTTIAGATMLSASAEGRIAQLEKGTGPRLRSEAKARRAEDLRRELRPFVSRPGISATLEELAARLPPTDHVRSARQGGDRILHVAIETPDATAAEAALKGSRLLPHAAVTDVAPAAGGRLAVTLRTSPR